MADNEEQDHVAGGVNEWEVVSLTASTYAASPGPRAIESNDDSTGKRYDEDEAESSRALFMSNHFIFPPNQHENLPLEPKTSEINVPTEYGVKDGGKSAGKDEEIWPLKDKTIPDEFPGMQFFNEKAKKLPISGTEFDECTTLQELSLHEKDHSIYSTSAFSSFHSETGLGVSAKYGSIHSISNVIEASEKSVDSSTDIIHSPKSAKDVIHGGSNFHGEAWWKRRVASLFSHAKEANTFWSLFVAAAVMGLVILGHRWQQEKWRSMQLKWHSSIKNEKTGRMAVPISRLKDTVVGGHGRGSLIRGSSSGEN